MLKLLNVYGCQMLEKGSTPLCPQWQNHITPKGEFEVALNVLEAAKKISQVEALTDEKARAIYRSVLNNLAAYCIKSAPTPTPEPPTPSHSP